MKTIVVATDFSAPAERAMLYAGQLASVINASVLLLHVYQIPVGMNDMPVLVVSTDELKKNAEAGLERAKKILQTNYSSIDVQTEARLGDVIDELEDVCSKINPVVVVTGKHGASGVQRILFGSTSLSIIRHASYPVITVPDSWRKDEVSIAALAIDESVEKLEIQKIRSLVQELKIQLRIIHVKQEKSASLPVKNLVTELNSNYETIYDHEFVHGIESYVKQNDVDLLIIHPHKHNLVERLFFRTHTKELLKKISIPIMCINENVHHVASHQSEL
jgi:nucleotide-binding universal stress UspA family protein